MTLCVAVLATLGSCAGPRPAQTPAMRATESITASTAEMRYWTHDLAYAFVTSVERAANEIRDRTDDRDIEEFALLWKVRAVSSCQQAAFRADPLIAFADLWTLIEQQRRFFTDGDGMGVFGELQPIATESLEWTFDRAVETYLRVSDGSALESSIERTRTWAEKYPITAPLYRRQPMVGEVTDALGIRGGQGLGALGSLDERLEILIERMPFYTEYLPKQAVWQLELTLLQSAEGVREDTGLAELESLRALEGIRVELDRVADVTDGLRAIIEDQRDEILVRVDERLDELTGDADAMRVATVDDVESLVDAELDEIVSDAERVATDQRTLALAEIERMRAETIEELRAEREAILAEARLIAADTVAQAMGAATGLVDRAMWALTVRVGLVGAAIVVGLVVVIRWLVPRPAPA